MRLIQGAALAAVAITLAACDTTSAVAPYSASTQNVLALQGAMKSKALTAKVGEFQNGGVTAPTCRMAGSLDVTNGKPIEQYLKEALQTELFTAQVLDGSSPVTISGKLDELKVNTFGTGSWTIGLQVASNKDPVGYHVQTVRTFKSSYSAMAACQNATNAFAPTVQDLISLVVSNPGYPKLLGQ